MKSHWIEYKKYVKKTENVLKRKFDNIRVRYEVELISDFTVKDTNNGLMKDLDYYMGHIYVIIYNEEFHTADWLIKEDGKIRGHFVLEDKWIVNKWIYEFAKSDIFTYICELRKL